MYIYHIFIIHSSVDRHLGPYLGKCKQCCCDIGVCVSFQISVFVFFGYIPRSGIAGSCGSSILVF